MENLNEALRIQQTMMAETMERMDTMHDQVIKKSMEVKAIMAKKDQKIFDLQSEMRKKDDLQKGMITFLIKSIEEKEAALECPVCLETAKAPIFMCQQQHLICFKCRPRLTLCPECREAYQGLPRRHRYAERDAEELEKMRKELTSMTS